MFRIVDVFAFGVPHLTVTVSVLIVFAFVAKAVAACIFGHDRNWRH